MQEQRKQIGDNLGSLHHEFMNNSEYYSAFESRVEERRDCLINHLIQWREAAGLSVVTVADRMDVSPSTVARIEKNPLMATVNTIARYAHACGLKVSIEPVENYRF